MHCHYTANKYGKKTVILRPDPDPIKFWKLDLDPDSNILNEEKKLDPTSFKNQIRNPTGG